MKEIMSPQQLISKKMQKKILSLVKLLAPFEACLFRPNRYFIILKKTFIGQESQNNIEALTKIIIWEDLKETVDDSKKGRKQTKNQPQRFSENNILANQNGSAQEVFLSCYRNSSKEWVSIAMSKAITSAQKDEKHDAYLFAVLLVVLNLLCFLTMHQGYNFAMIFSTKARMTIINLVYLKLTELSTYSIAEANIGKFLIQCLVISITLNIVCFVSMIFGCYILWDRFNRPIGLIALAIIFIVYPIQKHLKAPNHIKINDQNLQMSLLKGQDQQRCMHESKRFLK